MIQDEKELLLKDLCARLPYGIFVYDEIDNKSIYTISYHPHIDNCKPYLRPMSSMTEEEDKEWQIYKNNIAESCDVRLEERISELHDWFNCHHFDIHHLIEKGLALEAPNDMYKAE